MRRNIEISASFTGKISTGNFENESPFFSIKEIINSDDLYIVDLSDEQIAQRQKELHEMCYQQFKRHADAAYAERIANTYKNIRFYDAPDGKKYPSVTSIINMDSNFFMPADELQQHAARGNVIDKQIEIYLKTGEWKQPEEIPEIYPDLMTVKNGNLKLQLDDSNFLGFFKDYPFKTLATQDVLYNHEHQYAGRRDIKCLIESTNKGKWEKIEGVLFDVPTILDAKAGAMDKPKFMKQQTAYAKCDPDVKQIGIIHLNKENKCGYSQPVIETNLDKYWSLFTSDREKFRQRYGI